MKSIKQKSIKDLTYSEANAEAIAIAEKLIPRYPTTWRSKLNKNERYKELMERITDLNIKNI